MSCQTAEGGGSSERLVQAAAHQLAPSGEGRNNAAVIGARNSPESLGTVWNEPKRAVARFVMRAIPNADRAKNFCGNKFSVLPAPPLSKRGVCGERHRASGARMPFFCGLFEPVVIAP
jgi:hypothetical protein